MVLEVVKETSPVPITISIPSHSREAASAAPREDLHAPCHLAVEAQPLPRPRAILDVHW